MAVGVRKALFGRGASSSHPHAMPRRVRSAMPAPEPPAAPNRPSDGPWPGPGPPGPEPPADIGSARDGGFTSPRLLRSTGDAIVPRAPSPRNTAAGPAPNAPVPPSSSNVSVSSTSSETSQPIGAVVGPSVGPESRSEEHTSELQSQSNF